MVLLGWTASTTLFRLDWPQAFQNTPFCFGQIVPAQAGLQKQPRINPSVRRQSLTAMLGEQHCSHRIEMRYPRYDLVGLENEPALGAHGRDVRPCCNPMARHRLGDERLASIDSRHRIFIHPPDCRMATLRGPRNWPHAVCIWTIRNAGYIPSVVLAYRRSLRRLGASLSLHNSEYHDQRHDLELLIPAQNPHPEFVHAA